MKITVNVECTPEEARAFMGLPDLRPLNEAVMTQLQQQMANNFSMLDPTRWANPTATTHPMANPLAGMSEAMQQMTTLQQQFWAGLLPGGSGRDAA